MKPREREHQFVQELDRRLQLDPTVRPTEVADAIEMDPLELSVVLSWLMGRRLVGMVSGELPDPYTSKPIAITPDGEAFLASGVPPA